MSLFKQKITEVFTPRSATVNNRMYIDRPAYQRDLKRAVDGSLHTILCGESGSGKSWLYRHVAQIEGWKTFYANAGNAARQKSLTKTITDAVWEDGDKELREYTQTLASEIGALGTGASTEAERTYEVKSREILLRAFKEARSKAGSKSAVIVIDNLEAIFGKPELMEELGNIILLLDDPDYAKHRIKLLIVGVPAEIVEYYQKIENLETVANRVHELFPVMGMNWGQIEWFVRRGFVEQLKVKLSAEQVTEISKHIEWVTLGIAQRMHEYSELLAYNIEDSEGLYEKTLLEKADQKFLNSCIKKAYSVVDGSMNERKTKTGRRNQVLFALGKIQVTEFDVAEVERLVRSEFPISTENTELTVGKMLSDLTRGAAPLLRRASKGANFRYADPRYLMCIRLILRKSNGGETVLKATFKR
jgi:hypothetical protein